MIYYIRFCDGSYEFVPWSKMLPIYTSGRKVFSIIPAFKR